MLVEQIKMDFKQENGPAQGKWAAKKKSHVNFCKDR